MPEGSNPRAHVLGALVDRIRARFGDSVQAVLFYGSNLRDARRADDGLWDLFVVVSDYSRAFGAGTLAILNELLPPNVFYLQMDMDGNSVRAKYAVVTLSSLRRHTAPSCLQSYFWGRLAQPVVLAYAQGAHVVEAVDEILARAMQTFAQKTTPLLGSLFSAEALWSRGLEESYRTEFRPEKRRERARDLTDLGQLLYADAALALAARLEWTTVRREGRVLFSARHSGWERRFGRLGWCLRRWQGRALHVLRLVKATRTFVGGMDYLVWKIERHSGVKVEVGDRTRRHPLLFGWWTLWKLRKKGGFR